MIRKAKAVDKILREVLVSPAPSRRLIARVRFTADLPKGLHDRLSLFAVKAGKHKVEVVRELLDALLPSLKELETLGASHVQGAPDNDEVGDESKSWSPLDRQQRSVGWPVKGPLRSSRLLPVLEAPKRCHSREAP